MRARNALGEARRLVGPGPDPRVLEPSPPAVVDAEWFADDPFVGGDLDWAGWVRAHPDHEAWAARRWLAAHRRLGPVPPGFAATRLALHRLAVYVLSPARRRANGKIALRWTLDGMGTPFYGADEQVRLEGTTLVRQRGGEASAEPLVSLAQAARFVLSGPPDLEWARPFDVPPPGDAEEALAVDPVAAAFLGDWYGFAWSVLEELRAERESVDPSRVQLWPEHFDAAFDCLPLDRRATFGASPGDSSVVEPYLYVLPSAEVPRGDLWNACSFKGAVLPFGELVGAGDQGAAALGFLRTHRDVLVS
jgi:hypothetical protein